MSRWGISCAVGAGGVEGVGPAGCVRVRWWGSVAGFARLLRGVLGTGFWVFLNVVVLHKLWVFDWCSAGFGCSAHGCFVEDLILLWCLVFRYFAFSSCIAILGCALYD